MFRRKYQPPSRPFSHADNCKILTADPGVEIEWSNLGGGRWTRVCVCGDETWYEPEPERRRLDPLDPSTAKHAGECEFRNADRNVLRVVLKVRDGADGDYWWVECGACDTAWQVPHYAAESVG
jgi:hypothetical protein